MYGILVEGHYLTLRGVIVSYPTYPWETLEAAKARAESAVRNRCSWTVVDEKDMPAQLLARNSGD
jgi:hypothetical protein